MWPGAVACWARRNVRGSGESKARAGPRGAACDWIRQLNLALQLELYYFCSRSYGTYFTYWLRAVSALFFAPCFTSPAFSPRLGSDGKATQPLLSAGSRQSVASK